MTQVTFQGNPVELLGALPKLGSLAPPFSLTAADFSDIKLDRFAGQKVVLNIFPSLDTPVCAASVRAFNQQAASLENTVVICISADLPFAAARFFEAEDIFHLQHASTFRSPEFAKHYGVAIPDGAMRGLTARAVVCLDEDGVVNHSELVSEITKEPNYAQALAAL